MPSHVFVPKSYFSSNSEAAITGSDQISFREQSTCHLLFPHFLMSLSQQLSEKTPQIRLNYFFAVVIIYFLLFFLNTTAPVMQAQLQLSNPLHARMWFLSWCPFSAENSFCSMCFGLGFNKEGNISHF